MQYIAFAIYRDTKRSSLVQTRQYQNLLSNSNASCQELQIKPCLALPWLWWEQNSSRWDSNINQPVESFDDGLRQWTEGVDDVPPQRWPFGSPGGGVVHLLKGDQLNRQQIGGGGVDHLDKPSAQLWVCSKGSEFKELLIFRSSSLSDESAVLLEEESKVLAK